MEEIRKEPVKAEIKEAESKASDRTEGPAEPPKKRIAAVYRPQNSTQMRNNRPAGQSYGGVPSLSNRAVYREPETRLRKDRFRLRACRVHRSQQPAQPDNGSGDFTGQRLRSHRRLAPAAAERRLPGETVTVRAAAIRETVTARAAVTRETVTVRGPEATRETATARGPEATRGNRDGQRDRRLPGKPRRSENRRAIRGNRDGQTGGYQGKS